MRGSSGPPCTSDPKQQEGVHPRQLTMERFGVGSGEDSICTDMATRRASDCSFKALGPYSFSDFVEGSSRHGPSAFLSASFVFCARAQRKAAAD